jgi:hypothetical protein
MNVKDLMDFLGELDEAAEIWISDENGKHPWGCLLQKSDFKKAEVEGFDPVSGKILPLHPIIEIGMFDIYRRSNMNLDYEMNKVELYGGLNSRVLCDKI